MKFEITGLANGYQALVNVTLHLEALDPYIDKMDIVCHDAENPETHKPNLELTQSFSSNDFSVSGGKFIFYVPEDYADVPLTFTFSDLYSKYGDNTYYNDIDYMKMNGNARYSFVTSDYFKQFSGNKVSGITGFPVNGGLYDTAYLTNDKGSNGPVGTETTGNFYPYTSKVFTSTAGNVRFKFNNAEDLAAATGSLVEYPFSVSTYLSNYKDPDWKASSGTTQETGAFIPCILIANPAASPTGTQYQKTDIFYVFTADETRYNIAPTTGLQHRSYAFYRMDIQLEARTFTPKFTYEKIYDKSFQLQKQPKVDNNGNVVTENGKVVTEEVEVEDSMWGLILDAEEETDEVTGDKIIGYFTYQEIIDHIQGRGNPGESGYIPPTLDPNNTDAPKYMRQILYVDGTKLSAMLNSSENSIIKRLQDLKDSLAVNNLVFLPVNTTSTLDNVAYKTGSGSFRAGKDIVLKDKQPFFTPYTINVDAANVATYSREITIPSYTEKVINATVMLPFTLQVENGKHTNPNDGFAFTVNTMNGGDMDFANGSPVDFGTAYFQQMAQTYSNTEANVPYMIKITDFDNNVTTENGDKISFVAAQKGSNIIATPKNGTGETGGIGKKELEGESASGKFGGGNYNLTNWGSYSGIRYDRAESQDIFYFAQNMYLNLHSLSRDKRYLNSYPFRAVYKYTTAGNAKQMRGFYINYDEFQGVPTGIDSQETEADLMVKVGKGEVTLSATRAQNVTLYTIGGITMRRVDLNAGDTKTVNLPAGAYMVNGIKIIVK